MLISIGLYDNIVSIVCETSKDDGESMTDNKGKHTYLIIFI